MRIRKKTTSTRKNTKGLWEAPLQRSEHRAETSEKRGFVRSPTSPTSTSEKSLFACRSTQGSVRCSGASHESVHWATSEKRGFGGSPISPTSSVHWATSEKRGFSLVEIMTTVSIIAIITAIAVPNFMRIREEVNMEMVRGHLQTIHDAMNEFLNNNGVFPQSISPTPGQSPEELAITAQLTAIDLKEFDITYDQNGYFIRSCSRVLLRCFGVDPLGVHALQSWDGRGLNLVPHQSI